MRLESGALVGGRYRLERLLGKGGMGDVWAATHRLTRRPAALKFLRDARGRHSLRRFLREARAPGLVRHPNVLQVQDTVELADGTPVLVMELLEGESLGARLAHKGRIPLFELAPLLVPVVSAVGTAHAAGVIHRDLKPDNIFLCALPDGGTDVKVLDFGLAKLTAMSSDIAQSGDLTMSGEVLGTPSYMAPEQAFGEPVDHRADVWALGVILYECLSGRRPFPGANFGQVMKRIAAATFEPLGALVPDVPEHVARLVERMLSRDREARPGDLREVAELLQRYADVSAPSFDSAIAEATQGRRRWKTRTVAAIAIGSVGVGLSLAAATGWHFARRSASTHLPAAPVASPVVDSQPAPAPAPSMNTAAKRNSPMNNSPMNNSPTNNSPTNNSPTNNSPMNSLVAAPPATPVDRRSKSRTVAPHRPSPAPSPPRAANPQKEPAPAPQPRVLRANDL
jgi:serine/threonine-protein kinase